MIEFGKTLREAREAKGYTTSQVAAQTNLLPSIVEDLENENFTRIVAPIYGRGFVRLCCEAVGLDPQPMVAEFMEILNGNRNVTIRERPTTTPVTVATPAADAPERVPEPPPAAAPEPPPAAAPEPPPAAAPEPPPAATPVAAPEPPPAAAPDFATRAEPQPFTSDDLFALPPQDAKPAVPSRTLSRYAAPLRPEQPAVHYRPRLPKLPRIPSNVWRIAVLAALAIALATALAFGVRALYRATTGAPAVRPDRQPDVVNAAAEQIRNARSATGSPATAKAPAIPTARTPQKIPSLYAD